MRMDLTRHALLMLHALLLTACAHGAVAQSARLGVPTVRAEGPDTKAAKAVSANYDAATRYEEGKESPVMMPVERNDVSDQGLSAEIAAQRFLRLIATVQSKSNVSVKLVQEIMGVTLDSDPIYPSYRQPLGNGWFLALRYSIEMPGETWGVELEFHSDADASPQPFPFCTPSYREYHNALLRMGYRDRRGRNGTFPGKNQYDKEGLYVELDPELGQSTDGKAYPACVRKVGLFVTNDVSGHP